MHIPFEYTSLLTWFKIHGRVHLPWRKNLSPHTHSDKENGYKVWLSEILLQQTQAERVKDYYEKILERFPNIETLAQTDYETFFPYYEGLGYYSRARNLLKCAKIVSEVHQGMLPRETEQLVKLPGIGPYTAEAIRSFAYQIPTLSFDTNLKKVFARYYFGSRFHPISKDMEQELLADFLEFSNQTGASSADINGAFMDLGSMWCKNSKDIVDFSQSPFLHCLFTNTQGSLEIQEIREKTYFPLPDARIVAILHENHKTYYSQGAEQYIPFILPPFSTISEGNQSKIVSTREWVKKYFEDTYGLKVSVRPVHKKEYQNGVPYIFVHIQVQSGKNMFYEYTKGEYMNAITQI